MQRYITQTVQENKTYMFGQSVQFSLSHSIVSQSENGEITMLVCEIWYLYVQVLIYDSGPPYCYRGKAHMRYWSMILHQRSWPCQLLRFHGQNLVITEVNWPSLIWTPGSLHYRDAPAVSRKFTAAKLFQTCQNSSALIRSQHKPLTIPNILNDIIDLYKGTI